MGTNDTCRLSKIAFGLSLGTVWGLGMFVIGLFGTYCDYGVAFIKSFSSIYIGYEPTLWGAFLGFCWGFLDFFIFGFLVALFYNWYRCCCKKWCCKK